MLTTDEQHRYWHDGNRVPGFHEICKSLGIVKPNTFHTDAGREEGTALHEWCAFISSGQKPDSEPDPRIAGRVEGFRKFLHESGFKFEFGEQPQYHAALVYACTPDLIGQIAGARCNVEIKGGAVEKYHKLQTAAQSMALEANGVHCRDRYVLYLAEGSYRLIPHQDKDDERRWSAIVAAYHAQESYAPHD